MPPPGSDSIASVPATRPTPLAHRRQAEARTARPARRIGHLEPDPVVAHVERDHVAHVRQRQAGPRGAGVLGDVRERLLGGAQQRHLDLGVERQRVAGRR